MESDTNTKQNENSELTFLARKGGCLCSPAKRSTMTSSKSRSFSCRQVRTREVQVDMGAPYNLSAIDEDRAIDFTNNFLFKKKKMKENQTPSLLLY